MPSLLLDMSGAANVLGGDDAVSAMTAVHIYGNRCWLGWYNSPGSFQIATRLDSSVKSGYFRHVSSGTLLARSNPNGVYNDPMALLGLDVYKGPKYRAVRSDTIIEQTGYLGALFMKECAAWDPEGKVISGRRTQPISVTIANLAPSPAIEVPTQTSISVLAAASIPIIASITTSTVCALHKDWYAASLILVGIIANGISYLVLGSANFVLTYPESAEGSPAGDGVLTSDKDFVVLKGTQGAVNSITRGRLYLHFSSERHHSLLRPCSVLFFIQAMAQLFFISKASLFGQVMFLSSLIISALYNASLSSSGKEQIHRKLLFDKVLQNAALAKYTLGTHATAVVFILLVLKPSDPMGLLDELVPENTKVWKRWKVAVLEWLRNPDDQSFPLGGNLRRFTQQEKDLLELLYEDARAGYNGYKQFTSVVSDV